MSRRPFCMLPQNSSALPATGALTQKMLSCMYHPSLHRLHLPRLPRPATHVGGNHSSAMEAVFCVCGCTAAHAAGVTHSRYPPARSSSGRSPHCWDSGVPWRAWSVRQHKCGGTCSAPVLIVLVAPACEDVGPSDGVVGRSCWATTEPRHVVRSRRISRRSKAGTLPIFSWAGPRGGRRRRRGLLCHPPLFVFLCGRPLLSIVLQRWDVKNNRDLWSRQAPGYGDVQSSNVCWRR